MYDSNKNQTKTHSLPDNSINMGKTIEICHFKSFDRLLEKAEELERYFQPPAKPDEHYKLVFKKKRDAQVSDDHHVKVGFY